MDNSQLYKAAVELVKAIDKATDESLPGEISGIVKFHAKAAAAAGVASGWVPGMGGAALMAASAACIWTMYGRINGKIDVPLGENIVKSVISGITTNLVTQFALVLGIVTVTSFIPIIGQVGTAVVVGTLGYGISIAAGIIYIKTLTKVFKAGEDPTRLSKEELTDIAKNVAENEDVKGIMKEAKQEYKKAKKQGDV